MSDCLFCNIIDKTIPARIVYEDEKLMAFDDINPQAPHHILLIPKKHIPTINEAGPEDALVLGELLIQAKKLAASLNIDKSGYRLVFNVNKEGCQEVYHIHLHLIGGRQMNWPPG
jgi:histidine triad (HIT) family protein